MQEECQSTHFPMEYAAKFINIDKADLGENLKTKTEVKIMPLEIRTEGSLFTLSQF